MKANPAVSSPGREGIRTGEISILCATRGRPELLTQSFATLKSTTTRKDKTVLWVYVDEDDVTTREAIKAGKIADPGMTVNWHLGPERRGWAKRTRPCGTLQVVRPKST